MSVTTTYQFDNTTDYVFDPALIDISGGEAKLKLVSNPGQNFPLDFSADTGYTYDSAKAEFVGGSLRQKDQRQSGATFGVSYTSVIDGNWGGGTLTGTPVGVPTISGGKMVVTGGTVRGVSYPSASKYTTRQTGAIKLKYTPNYSGAPSGHRPIFNILQAGAGEANEIALYHNSAEGKIFANLYNSTSGAIYDGAIGFFLPTAGTEYEIEFNWDFTAGASRLFINGVQLGSTITGTGTISVLTAIKIALNYGNNMNSDGSFNDILCFDTPQHTANYTPGYTVSDYIYVDSVITSPEFEYTGAGTLISFDTFTTTEISAPRYTLQIGRSGNYLYWSGSAWVTSNGAYAQANDKSTFQAHLATLPVLGEIYGQFKIHFQNSGTQSSISALQASLTAQIYTDTNPAISLVANLRMESLVGFIETVTKAGLDNIKYILKSGSSYVYWNSTAWVASSGAYAQSNTVSEIVANIASFTAVGISFNLKIFLHSDDGVTTPSIQELSISYDYAGNVEDTFHICDVYWYSRYADGTVDNSPYVVSLNNVETNVRYKNNIIMNNFEQTVYADSTGYVEISLIDNVNMVDSIADKSFYSVKKLGKTIAKIYVPETDGELLWDIII